MKILIFLPAIFVVLAAAQPHRHAHAHLHREASPVQVDVPGPTVVLYQLNGADIPYDEVLQGIKNGSLVWAGDAPEAAPAAESTQVTAYTSEVPATSATSVSIAAVSTSEAASVASSYAAPSAATSDAATSSASSGSSASSWSGSSTGVDAPFPDGEIDCSDFPDQYGALSVSYMGLGGWIGIQHPGSTEGGYDNIKTIEKSSCADGNCCGEGMFCSYACPSGYQKSQWPSTQGATGQSIGGLHCLNGKLRLTNSALSSNLCIPGAEHVKIVVENNLSKNVAVCRTDYPGTESETVPMNIAAGDSDNLTCPDAATYYRWGGASTSAQYYVNPAGVNVEDACQWGSPSNPWGNYAPLNLGVGYSNGAAWLAIFQNAPTTDAKLDFAIEIIGDNVSGSCKYSNGQYCSGENYSDCSPTTGCTVSISSGTATFVFSDS